MTRLRLGRPAARALVVLGAICVLALSAPVSPTAAAPINRQTQPLIGAGPLRLVSQNTWLKPGDDVNVRISIGAFSDRESLELVVAVYPRVTSRSAFRENLTGVVRGSPLGSGQITTQVGELTADPGGAYLVSLAVQDPLNPQRGQVRFTREGVYPVRIEVRNDDGASVGRIATHVVVASSSPPTNELGVMTVVSVDHAISTQTDGSIENVSAGDARAVADLGNVVADHPGAVLLDIVPEFVEALEAGGTTDATATLDALVNATAFTELLQHSFVDLPAQYVGDPAFSTEFTRQEKAGRDALQRVLRTPSPSTRLLRDPIPGAAITAYAGSDAQRFIVTDNVAVPDEDSLTLALPVQLAVGSDRTSTAAIVDSLASAHLSPSDDPVLAGQHLLAELAVIWLERPSEERAVTLLTEAGALPDSLALQTFLDGLSTSPALEAVDDSVFFALEPQLNDDESLTVLSLASPALPQSDLADYLRTRSNITSYSLIVGESATDVSSLDRRLLVAAAAELSVDERAARITAIRSDIETELSGLRLPDDASIRLTARTGEIPITISNTTGKPVRVVLRLDSDRLTFPNGNRLELLLEEENQTERIAVEALGSGEFRVVARLESPDSALTIDSSALTVRSTAASWVGFVITGVAAAVLASWWLRQVVRNRMRRPA